MQPEDVAIPLVSDPGESAQVDFGYAGRLYDPEAGVLRKAWVFVMVLSYSRHMTARIVFDQKVETWLDLHVDCFRELGGVPREIIPDNLKAAVIRAAFGAKQSTALNRSYRDLARYYGFRVDPTPVRQPQKKGKVEAGVKYVKRNFFQPRGEMDVEEARRELQRWLEEIAGLRKHGSTGKQPRIFFEEEERSFLLPLPRTPYRIVVWKEARVHTDSHIQFENRLYSVHWRLVGKKVWVRAVGNTVELHHEDERVATHPRKGPGRHSTFDEHLPSHRVDWRYRSHDFWRERAAKMGEEVALFIEEVFACDEVLSQLRAVQAIVTHLESFPVDRAQAACRRARYYGSYSYGSIKQILKRALDLEKLPGEEEQPKTLHQPRFARSAREWKAKEGGHVCK